MFEIIDSKYTRDRYKEKGFQLTDFQKATLIWNKPKITQQERLSALKNLAINTADSDLRFQIGERIAYEEKVMKQFKAALYGEMLYVVFDSDVCAHIGLNQNLPVFGRFAAISPAYREPSFPILQRPLYALPRFY